MPLLWASSRASAICLATLEGLVDGNGAAGEPLLGALPLHELEGEVSFPSGLLEPVDGGDVGVVEGGEKVGLALEAPQALGVLPPPRAGGP